MPLLSKSQRPRSQTPPPGAADLRAPDPTERRRAVRAMALEPDSAPTLADHLLREADPSVRSAIFYALGEMGTEAAADALTGLIAGPDATLRSAAAAAARGMPDLMSPRLALLLANPEPELRVRAAAALLDLGCPETPALFLDLLTCETDANVAGALVDGLAQCGSAEALPVLRATRQRFAEIGFLRFACDFACSEIESGGLAQND